MRINHYPLILAALSTLACDRLPEFPNAAIDRVPASLEFNGLTLAEGFEGAGGAVNPADILAGTAVEAAFTVRAQDGLPLEGALIQFGVKTEQWARILDFPLGTSCTTDEEGQCSTVLRSERRAGPGQFEARVGRLPPQSIDILVNPDEAQAKVTVEIEGLGTYNWETGQRVDPLNNESTRLVLNKDQAQGTTLRVRLLDAFDNPLVGLPVTLTVLIEQGGETSNDAGPTDAALGDNGSRDTATVLDASAGDQGTADVGQTPARDSGLAADSGLAGDSGVAGDSGLADDSGSAADTGANKVLSSEPESSRAMVSLAGAEGCPVGSPAGSETAGDADDDGYVRFCVFPGQDLGDFTITIRPAELFVLDAAATTMALTGQTLAGEASQIRYLLPDGQTEARIWCHAGQLSDVAVFSVENDAGPVPFVNVAFSAEGGITTLSSRLQESDDNGRVRVEAVCPRRLLTGGRIIARLAESDSERSASVAVEVIANAITRVVISRHGDWPDQVHSNAELGFRVRAFDADDLPVIRTGLRPEDGAPDTREFLQFNLSMASVGHAEALRLAESNEPIINELLTVDSDTGAADVTLRVTSRATYANPIVLRAQPVGSEVGVQTEINVMPGEPSHLVVSPAGVVEALLGGAAGELVFTALDGLGDAANAVPDVPIQIVAPASLLLAANWTNRLTFEGRTGPDGRFRVTVLQANALGDALVTGTLQTAGGPVVASTTVRVGEGAAASLTLTLDGEALPQEEGLPSLTMRAATTLTQTLALRILNSQGAGLEGRGLSIDLESGDEGNCASFGAPGVSDQTGSISYGPGLLTLTAGGNIGTCIYRLAHGMTPASARLRIVQVPGPPLTAVLTAAAVRNLDNYPQSPNQWTDDTSVAVTLQALDANNLAPEGLRMWLDISNCYVSQRAFELDADGRASFRVAGGGDDQADCSLRPRYFNELEQYETRAVNGRAQRDGESVEEAAARPELLIETGGFEAPELISVDFDNERNFVMTSSGTTHRWDITANGLRYPNLLGNEDCNPAAECTQAQLVAMQRNDDGAFEVRLDGNGAAQVLRDAIFLNYTFVDQNEPTVRVTLREGWLGAGRWLGLRLKHPGENGAVSTAQPFYAQPPTQWTGAGPGGAGGVMTITRPDGEEGDVTIGGGWRGNLHGDATPELLLCGTDASGGWFAVVHLDQNGALPSEPQQAVRSWSGGSYQAPFDDRFTCAVADLDNDGRDDLVVLAAPQNDRPSLVVHRGTGDAQVFRAAGERLNWLHRDLNNTSPGSLDLEVGPAAVVVCLDRTLADHRGCQNRKRLLLNLPEDAAGEAAGFESLGVEFIAPADVLPLTEGRFVSASGALSPQGWLTGHTESVYGVAFSPDGQTIASAGGPDFTIKLWNASNGALIRTLTGHTNLAYSVAFSPDGQTLASASTDQSIKLWNASSGALIRTLTGHTSGVYRVAFSPDGQTIASGSQDMTIKLWNASTGALIRTLTGHNDGVIGVSFSPDGQTIASASGDDTIKLWNASTGAPLLTLVGHDRDAYSVSFSPNGQTLASTGEDRTIKLWSASTGVLLSTLTGHTEPVYGVSFSPDGQTLASASGDSTIKLWNASTGVLLSTLFGHTGYVVGVSFSPDGQTLASAGFEGRVGLWVARGGQLYSAILSPGIGTPLPGQSGQEPWAYLAAYSTNEIRLKRPYTWRPLCGDGVVDDGEYFDNGQPWTAGEFTTQCGATCGDTVVQLGEDCDDGNDSNADACSALCQVHSCGDGLVRQDLRPGDDGYEYCDDGNQQSNDACAPDCNGCGDSVVGHFESCDDGNDVADDGCSNCVLDSCGNAQLDQGESCDDGNQNDDDGCFNTCRERVSIGPLSLGDVTNCILGAGIPYCMGRNSNGAVGDGTHTNRSLPTRVRNLTDVVQLSGSAWTKCALKSNGTVWCWGRNISGQLGDGTNVNRNQPVRVVTLAHIVELEGGARHHCARRNDGTVWCWGHNGSGQLGDDSTTDRNRPVQVSGINNAVQIAAGFSSCARLGDGTTWCWGDNQQGQVGDGTNTQRTTPVRVSNDSGFIDIQAGYHHSCARKANGTLWCWGGNQAGQLGDGTRTNRNVPTQVLNVSDATAIAVGGFYKTCAIRSWGLMWCWGDNMRGQLGDGTTTLRRAPVRVIGLGAVTHMARGGAGFGNFARTATNETWAWGMNHDGSLGLGNPNHQNYNTPQRVPGF